MGGERMTTCTFCKKEYEGYVIIISDNIECYLMEDFIKKIYYNNKKDIGVCKKCRKSEIDDNPVCMIRSWLSVKCELMLAKSKAKDNNDIKLLNKYKEALKRIKEYEKELEKTQEVQELYLKNNPASFKSKPDKTRLCDYCNENKGQKWINDPNNEPKIDTCWWICIPCEKIMERQRSLVYLTHFQNIIKKQKLTKLDKNVKEEADKLLNEIKDIAYEDGQDVCCFEMEKDEKGNIKKKHIY